MIFIDNIDVCYEGRYMMGANVPETVVAADEMTFKAFVTAGSSIEKPFSHIEASVESLTTGAKSTYAADVNIEADKTYEFTFPDKISLKERSLQRVPPHCKPRRREAVYLGTGAQPQRGLPQNSPL